MLKFSVGILALLNSIVGFSQSSESVQKRNLAELSKRKAEVKQIMDACAGMTQKSDVGDRGLANKIKYDLGGDQCLPKNPFNGSLEVLNKQIKSVYKFVDISEIWTDITDIAHDRAVKSIWATHMMLIKDEKLTEASAIALICKHTPASCQGKQGTQNLKRIFASFQKETAAHPVKYLSGTEQAAILKNELQPLIERINKICMETKDRTLEIDYAFRCAGRPSFETGKDGKFLVVPSKQQFSMGECSEKQKSASLKQKPLIAPATQSIELDMQRIVGSKLGALLITKDLRDKMGVLPNNFVQEKCMKKGDGKLLAQVSNGDLSKARSDFFALTVAELKKVNSQKGSDYDHLDKKATLRQYVKTNPSTIAEFLNTKPDRNKALAACSLIKEIHGLDKAGKIVDGVVIGTGVVASVALGFTGVGAPAGLALAGLMMTKSTLDYSYLAQQDALTRSSVATKQKNLGQGLDDLKKSDQLKKESIDDIKMIAAGEVAGFGLGRGMKYLTALKNAKSATVLVGAEKALAEKLEYGAKFMRRSVEDAGEGAAHLTKMNAQQEARLAAIYADLSADEAKVVTKELAGLKTEKDLDKFLQNSDQRIKFLKERLFYQEKAASKSQEMMVTEKRNVPLELQVRTDSQTRSLLSRVNPEEQTRIENIAKDLKDKLKMSDEQVMAKMAKLQEDCLTQGKVKGICLEMNLKMLESEISGKPAQLLTRPASGAWKTEKPVADLDLRVKTDAETRNLYSKLEDTDKARMNSIVEGLKGKSVPEEQILEKIAKVQNDCLTNGVVKKSCLDISLAKLESEVSGEPAKLLNNPGSGTWNTQRPATDLEFKIRTSSGTRSLYSKLDDVNKGRVNSIVEALKVKNIPEDKVLERLSRIQEGCISKGVVVEHCFDLYISKIESEISGEPMKLLNREISGASSAETFVPSLEGKVRTRPETRNFISALNDSESAQVNSLASQLKERLKLSDDQVIAKIAKMEEECLFKGALKKGCLQVNLAKLEAEATGTKPKFVDMKKAEELDNRVYKEYLEGRVRTAPETRGMVSQLNSEETERLNSLASSLKNKQKLTDDQVVERFAKIQKSCTSKGILDLECFKTSLSGLEQDLKK